MNATFQKITPQLNNIKTGQALVIQNYLQFGTCINIAMLIIYNLHLSIPEFSLA